MNPAGTELDTRDYAKPGTTPHSTYSKAFEAGDAPVPNDLECREQFCCDDTSTTTTALLSTSGVYSAPSSCFYEHSTYCWSPGVPPGAFSSRPSSSTDSYVDVRTAEVEEEATRPEEEKISSPPSGIEELLKCSPAPKTETLALPNNEVRHIAVTPPGQHFYGSDRWGWLPEDFAALDCVLSLQSYLCNPPSRKISSEAAPAACPSSSTDSFASTQWESDDDGHDDETPAEIEC